MTVTPMLMQNLVKGLPDSVRSKIEMQPVVDLMMAVLREELPDITFLSAIPQDQDVYPDGTPFPDLWVLVHKTTVFGQWEGEERFINAAAIELQVFSKNPDGELKGELVSEALRIALQNGVKKNKLYPGLGVLHKAKLVVEPTRQNDWATSTGPVQFADLPGDYSRVVSRYDIRVRRDIWTLPSD